MTSKGAGNKAHLQPVTHFLVHIGIGIARVVFQRAGTKFRYVTLVVLKIAHMAVVSPFAAAEMTGNGNRFSDFLTVFIICFSLQILFDFRKRGFPVPENRRAYNIQQFSNFRVAHVQEVGQKDNVAFPFGQSVKGFGKQFIFDEYIKAGHLKTEIIAFVFVRCEKLREFAFAQIRKRYFACCAFRKSAAVAFRFANQSFLC